MKIQKTSGFTLKYPHCLRVTNVPNHAHIQYKDIHYNMANIEPKKVWQSHINISESNPLRTTIVYTLNNINNAMKNI